MKFKIITIGIMAFVLTVTSVPAQDTLIFSTFPAPNPIAQICQPIIQTAYKKIGIDAIIHYYPPARAIQLANAGYTDGALFRSVYMDEQFSNLVMVPVAITQTDVVAFTQNLQFPLQGWESLKPYRIGLPRGFKFVEARTAGMNTYAANNVEKVFHMLAAGRVDVVITTRFAGLRVVNNLYLTGIQMLTPPLEEVMFYHFLHKRHQHLVPKLAAVLEEMEKTGEIKEIRQRVEETSRP